jgi:hypothetical protein
MWPTMHSRSDPFSAQSPDLGHRWPTSWTHCEPYLARGPVLDQF